MDLKDYIRLLQLRWITALVVGAVVFCGLFLQRSVGAPVYRATATLLFKMSGYEYAMIMGGEAPAPHIVPAKSRAQLLKSDEVLQAASAALKSRGILVSRNELEGSIRVDAGTSEDTTIVHVTHPSEKDSLQIIETLIDQFTDVESESQIQGYRRERDLLAATVDNQKNQLEDEKKRLSEEIRANLAERGIYDPELQGQVKAQILLDTERSRQQTLHRMKRIEFDLKKLPAPLEVPPADIPTVALPPTEPLRLPPEPSQTPAALRLVDSMRKLKALSRKYTQEHPDLISLKADLDELRQEAFLEATEASVKKRDDFILEREFLGEFALFMEQVAHQEYAALSALSERKGALGHIQTRISGLQSRLAATEDRLTAVERNLAISKEERKGTLVVLKQPTAAKVPTPRGMPPAMMAVVSVISGLTAAFTRQAFDYAIRDVAMIKRHLNLPVLASIPEVRRGPVSLLELAPRTPLWDNFHYLGAVLLKSPGGEPRRVFMLSSGEANTGKSLLTANLGIAMAGEHRRILIIDADMRNPTQHEFFSLDNSAGLSSYLSGRLRATSQLDEIQGSRPPESMEPRADLEEIEELGGEPLVLPESPEAMRQEEVRRLTRGVEKCILPTSVQNLFVMPAGLCPVNPPSLLDSPEASALVHYARANYDMVIIDTPPLAAASDGLMLAPSVDAVTLIVACGKTRRETALLAKQMLEKVQAGIAGAVLNFSEAKPSEYYYYYSYGPKTSRTAV